MAQIGQIMDGGVVLVLESYFTCNAVRHTNANVERAKRKKLQRAAGSKQNYRLKVIKACRDGKYDVQSGDTYSAAWLETFPAFYPKMTISGEFRIDDAPQDTRIALYLAG